MSPEPTGSAKFAELIRKGDFETATRVARQQVENGAQVIDICVPASDQHLRSKFGKDRTWLLDAVSRHVAMALDAGLERGADILSVYADRNVFCREIRRSRDL